jgi:hypothetical protein
MGRTLGTGRFQAFFGNTDTNRPQNPKSEASVNTKAIPKKLECLMPVQVSKLTKRSYYKSSSIKNEVADRSHSGLRDNDTGRYLEEMLSTFPVHTCRRDQFQVGFVNESRRVERFSSPSAPNLSRQSV